VLYSHLKCRKAGGLDNITYEHLKYGGRSLNEHLVHLFNLVIKYEFILKDWKYDCIITLHKGGNKSKKTQTIIVELRFCQLYSNFLKM
jgi:predicted transcriptional regulator